jgi:hypothetical protein
MHRQYTAGVNVVASPFYDAPSLQTLAGAISPPRLASYLAEAGDLQSAIDLYVWNVRASAALYGPLSILDVALRNALHRELKSIFVSSWHDDPGFATAAATVAEAIPRNAPYPYRGSSKPTDIRPAISDAKKKIEARLRVAAGANATNARGVPTTDDIVGAMDFGFWTKLLNADMEPLFWAKGLYRAFPHRNVRRRVPRSVISARFRSIRNLRNRVMHFEPLLNRSLHEDLRNIVEACGWIDPTCSAWIEHHSSLDSVLRDRYRPRHPL